MGVSVQLELLVCQHNALARVLCPAVSCRHKAECVRRRAEARVELHPYIKLLLSRPPPPYIADPGWGDAQVR